MNLGAENNRFDTIWCKDLDVENGVIGGGGDISVGTIIPYMGTTPPKDFLACDGTVYNIAKYQQLANHINRQFGSYNFFGGDGTTTFAVPDLRGEFLRGTGTNSHTNQGSGANVGVHQDSTTVPTIYTTGNGLDGLGMWTTGTSTQQLVKNADGGSTTNYYTYVSLTDKGAQVEASGLNNVRPTNTSVLYCIKYKSSNDITNATSLDETLLYSGNDQITATTGSTAYTLSDDITNFDYIIIEVEGNQQNATSPSTTRLCSSQELENTVVYYGCSIGEHRGDAYTTYFDGWVSCATSLEASTTTIRFALRDKTSNINSVILKSVIGIKKNSLSTADIAEMAMPSEVGISVNSGDTVNANGWLNVGIRSSSDNGAIEIKISNSGVDRYENIRVIGSGLWTANSFAVRKDSTITFKPSNGATIGWASLSYSVGDAKALGLL